MAIINNNNVDGINQFNSTHSAEIQKISKPISAITSAVLPEIMKEVGFTENDFSDSPYQIWPIGLRDTKEYYIIENVDIVNNILQLTQEEMMALIAHEIGHIMADIKGICVYEEIYADEYAASLGYKESLIAALNKIVHNGKGPKTYNSINQRISHLQSL